MNQEQTTTSNNARIAKNTMLLYIRQILLLGISLFTSRVILNSLGIDDYGIYNVVGGVVAMFSIFTGSLSISISRFLSIGLGEGEKSKLVRIFSTSVNIQVIMAIIVGMILEIVGVWFLNTHLNIPHDRINAANIILQTTIFIFIINLINVPYNAAIIAHEKMNVFAYTSIIEAVMKLIVAYSLYISPYDKLIVYGSLLAVVSLIMRLIYGIYCGRTFEECHYYMVIDKKIIKEMTGFAGWNFFGSGAYLFNTQGINIVTNLYFGVTANAARGVSNQVESIIKQFVNNFTTAINPQIMKSHASGNIDYMHSLVCRGARFSFYLMLFFTLPFIFETEFIMRLWLNIYPPEAPLFLRLSLIGTMVDLLGNTTAFAVWATGRVKKYYLFTTPVGALVFPLSYLLFHFGLPAYSSYIVFAFIYFILIFIRLYILHGLTNLQYSVYLKDVLLRIAKTSIASLILPFVFYKLFERSDMTSLLNILLSIASVAISIYILGLTSYERNTLKTTINSRIENFKTHN